MKIVYGTQYIEIDFGQRDEGYKLSLDLETHIAAIKLASNNGAYSGGCYFGPVRPLSYVEIPFDSLDESLQRLLDEKGSTFTPDRWEPKFKSCVYYIK